MLTRSLAKLKSIESSFFWILKKTLLTKCRAIFIFLAANGYVRSEGVMAIFIQTIDDAKRIYGCIHDIMDNCNGEHKGGERAA